MKRLGIKELAKLLSLNPSTVSRALADHPDIKPETRERVKAAAKEFNYQPNLHARFFRKRSSGLIAVILPSYNMFFIPNLLEAINEHLKKEGYGMIVFFSDLDLNKEKEIINHCMSWLVDGVLICLASSYTDHLRQLTDAGIPFVIIDNSSDYVAPYSTVSIDNKTAAYRATEYLIKKDKKNILGIFGPQNHIKTQQRLDGFKSCLLDYNVTFSEYDIVFNEPNLNKLENKLRSTPYNGIFIMNDELLLITYPILLKNRQIPGNISLITISDGVLTTQLFPKISHIRYSGYELGITASSFLLKYVKNKKNQAEIEHIVVSSELVDFESD
jgi:LacI family transcriptional regulator